MVFSRVNSVVLQEHPWVDVTAITMTTLDTTFIVCDIHLFLSLSSFVLGFFFLHLLLWALILNLFVFILIYCLHFTRPVVWVLLKHIHFKVVAFLKHKFAFVFKRPIWISELLLTDETALETNSLLIVPHPGAVAILATQCELQVTEEVSEGH